MARWLSSEEQSVWVAYVRMRQRIEGEIAIGLLRDGISAADYELLAALSDVQSGHMRAKDLAAAVTWNKSRLSRQLSRMEARGLVTREPAIDDARGLTVALTQEGRKHLERVAPRHVDLVRQLFVDQLTTAEARSLVSLSSKVIAAADALHS
nr:MarR family transcriptional regulator [Mycobacteroides chelonae]